MTFLALSLFHTFAVGPAFLYIGLNPQSVPDSAYTALLVTGALILAYHAYKAFTKLRDGKSAWVNWIHIFLVAPLLMIVGYLKKDANSRYFEMMLLLGFAAIGYHALYLIRDMMVA
jgi:hypothetical protein